MSSTAKISKDNKIALLFGVEGLVGKAVLDELLKSANYHKIKVFQPKITAQIDSPKVGYVQFSYHKLNQIDPDLIGDDLYLCFDKSFYDQKSKHRIPDVAFKQIPKMLFQAQKNGVKQCILLSSRKAHYEALNTINKVRGLLELSVYNLKFWGTYVYKPGLIFEPNFDNEWGADAAQVLNDKINQLTRGWWHKNKPIENVVIAKAMIENAQKLNGGKFEYKGSWLQDYHTYLLQLKQ